MGSKAPVIFVKTFAISAGVICTLAGGYTLLDDSKRKKIQADPASKYPKNLEDKVYLVTGANTG